MADRLTCTECDSELEDDGCTNPTCSQWRFGEAFDAVVEGDDAD